MKVLVLMGGASAERDVSLASGEAICQGLHKAGIEAAKLDTALGGRLTANDRPSLPDAVGKAPPKPQELPEGDCRWALEALRPPSTFQPDIVFLAFHGGAGENGTVQAVLDVLGIPYTGSGVLASALAMDKNLSKLIFRQVGVPTPPWFVVKDMSVSPQEIARDVARTFGFPCVVKPNDQGSTVGFSVVEGAEALPSALAKAAEYTQEILIERYIPGRELTVAILEGEPLPVVEIVPRHGVYDYECKYTDGMSDYIVPAQIPQVMEAEIRDAAVKAFRALKCEDYGRVDFRFDEQDEALYCLEVNSLPGMTHHSLVPKAAQAAGIDFPELVGRIAALALKRAGRECRA